MAIRRLVILLFWLSLAPLPVLAAVNARDMVLVLDNSGSMKKNDPQFLTSQAVTGFLRELDGDTRVAIIIFDQDVRMVVPMTPVDADSREAILASLRQVNYRGKYTDSPAAMERAIYTLENDGRAEASKSIIFMTDGIVDTGDTARDREMGRWLREDLTADAASAGIRIFAIAFTEKADFHLIQGLARKTGGDYFRALAPSDLEGVFRGINEKLTPAPAPEPAPAPVPEPAPAPVPESAPEPASGSVPESATVMPESSPDALPATPPGPAPEVAPAATVPETPIIAPVMPVADTTAKSTPNTDTASPQPVPAVAPQSDDQPLLILLGGAVLSLIVVVLVMLLRRRGAGAPQPAVTPVATQEYVPEAYLNDIHGITDARTHPLAGKACMLGRVAGKDTEHLDYFVIPETTVGRRHALIEYKDFSYWLIDQGSVNGTFVNDERITEPRRLKHGDRIRLHQYEFEFCLPEMADSGMTVFSNVDDPQHSGAEATVVMAAAPPQEPEQAAAATPGVAQEVEDDGDAIDLDTADEGAGFNELETDINITGLEDDSGQAPAATAEGGRREQEGRRADVDADIGALFEPVAPPAPDGGDGREAEPEPGGMPDHGDRSEPSAGGEESPVAVEEMSSVFEEFGMLEDEDSLGDDGDAVDDGLFDAGTDDTGSPTDDGAAGASLILDAEETTLIKAGAGDDDDEVTLMPDQAPDKLSMDTFISTSIFSSGPPSEPVDDIGQEDESGQTIQLNAPVEQAAPEAGEADEDFHEETTIMKGAGKDET